MVTRKDSKVVMTYLKVLSQHSLQETEEEHVKRRSGYPEERPGTNIVKVYSVTANKSFRKCDEVQIFGNDRSKSTLHSRRN
jgi:hypothetical protein